MGIGSIVGGVVGFAVGGPVGAAVGAGLGGTKAGQSAVDAVGDAAKMAAGITEEIIEGFGTIIYKGGVAIVDAIGDVAKSSFNVLHGTIALRSLRESERVVLRPVFGDSVPLDRVVVTSLIGMSHRPLCLPGSMITGMGWALPGIGPLLGVYSIVRGVTDKYLLCLGPEGYNNSLNMPFDNARGGQTLVHEMTHVWQGHNQLWSWGYVIESMFNQCKCGVLGGDPYAATPGLQWMDYNAEQQGRLVEQWYIGSGALRRKSGAAMPNPAAMAILDAYMVNNVRPGAPKLKITLPSTMGVGSVTSPLTASSASEMKLGGVLKTGGNPAIKPGSALVNGNQLTAAQRDAYGQLADQMYAQARTLRGTRVLQCIQQAELLESQAAQLMSLSGRPVRSNGSHAPASISHLIRR